MGMASHMKTQPQQVRHEKIQFQEPETRAETNRFVFELEKQAIISRHHSPGLIALCQLIQVCCVERLTDQ